MPLSTSHLRSAALLVLPVILAWTWVSLNGYQGLNGQDAHDYLRLAKAWTAWAHGGPLPHLFEHPHGYPIAGALLGLLVGSEGLALRLISAASLLVIAFVFRDLLRRAFPRDREHVDAFVLLTLVLSPFLLRHALVVMSDVPGIALLAVAFACTVRWIKEQRVPWLIGAAVAATLAIAVRFAAAPLALVMAAAIVHGPSEGRRRRWTIALGLLVIGALVVLFTLPMDRIRTLLAHSPVGDWSALDLFRRELCSDDGVLRYRF
ncbi:MAG TPA: glycosyltransferase family 39 protein, partial [Flavobacteriales bacterium]|nr:glycosyltransferase family 39 protein [Flavobacteriales bacterium]